MTDRIYQKSPQRESAPPSRKPLVRAVEVMPDEAWSWFVAWALGLGGPFPDGLGGFTPASRAAIEKLRAEAAVYLERAAGGQSWSSAPPEEPERRCRRCGHPDHWHRHDDERCLSSHPQPCSLPGTLDAQRGAPLAPFRCLGYDCERPGFPAGTPESRCGCLDFVRPEHD